MLNAQTNQMYELR